MPEEEKLSNSQQEERTTLNLHQKLLKIADAAGILQKTKSGFNYKYVPEEEIQAKVTAGMQKWGVMLYNAVVPGSLRVTPYTYSKLDKKTKQEIPINEFVVQADTTYTWVNVDDPTQTIEVPWVIVGSMEDASQAFGAAETYCNRYFLMKTLQLATSEDDPDSYRSKQKEAEKYEDEKERKKAEEQLKKAVGEVVALGAELMGSGVAKETIMKIVGDKNGGNQNPSSIKSLEICSAVKLEFEKLKKSNTKGTAKEDTKQKTTENAVKEKQNGKENK